jgi:hypothetical protein
VFNPSKEKDRILWNSLEQKAKENGHEVNDFAKEIILNYLKKSR